MIVQGDVFFTKAKAIPTKAKPMDRKARGYVIAEGEATGHAHVIEDEALIYEKYGTMYVHVLKQIEVRHEEHRPITLTPGLWKVGIVREYDPFLEEARRVTD
jgi:hypothetical protein